MIIRNAQEMMEQANQAAEKNLKKIQKVIKNNFTGERLQNEKIDSILKSSTNLIRAKTLEMLETNGFTISKENESYYISM